MLACVGYIAGKVLSNNAVPVRRVFTVEELLDALADLLFRAAVIFINCQVNLLFDVLLHLHSHLADYPLYVTFSHYLNYKFKSPPTFARFKVWFLSC